MARVRSSVTACRKVFGVSPAMRVKRRCSASGSSPTSAATRASDGWLRHSSVMKAIARRTEIVVRDVGWIVSWANKRCGHAAGLRPLGVADHPILAGRQPAAGIVRAAESADCRASAKGPRSSGPRKLPIDSRLPLLTNEMAAIPLLAPVDDQPRPIGVEAVFRLATEGETLRTRRTAGDRSICSIARASM